MSRSSVKITLNIFHFDRGMEGIWDTYSIHGNLIHGRNLSNPRGEREALVQCQLIQSTALLRTLLT